MVGLITELVVSSEKMAGVGVEPKLDDLYRLYRLRRKKKRIIASMRNIMIPATNPPMMAVLLPREVLELGSVSVGSDVGSDAGALLELSAASSTLKEGVSGHKIRFDVIR